LILLLPQCYRYSLPALADLILTVSSPLHLFIIPTELTPPFTQTTCTIMSEITDFQQRIGTGYYQKGIAKRLLTIIGIPL